MVPDVSRAAVRMTALPRGYKRPASIGRRAAWARMPPEHRNRKPASVGLSLSRAATRCGRLRRMEVVGTLTQVGFSDEGTTLRLDERQARPDVPPAVIGDYVLPVNHINFREIHHLLLQAFMLRAAVEIGLDEQQRVKSMSMRLRA